MARGGDTLTDLELYEHHESSTGYLVSDDGDDSRGVWIDKDKVEKGERTRPFVYEFTMPQWYAEKKGLV